VVGRQDAEADLATRIRSVLGPDVLVSASMDLHGNVSRELGTAVDLITCYRMAPHEDAMESRERALRNLVERVRSGLGKPGKAWVQVPRHGCATRHDMLRTVQTTGRRIVSDDRRRSANIPLRRAHAVSDARHIQRAQCTLANFAGIGTSRRRHLPAAQRCDRAPRDPRRGIVRWNAGLPANLKAIW